MDAQLVFGDKLVESTTGFLQGDPLSVLLFALVLHPVILRIQNEVPDLRVNGWFLDDGLVAGTRGDLCRAVDILLEDGPARGPHLSTEITVPNNSKSAVWCPHLPDDDDPLGKGIKPVRAAGFTHLGAAVGQDEFVEGEVMRRIEKVKLLLGKLSTLENSHSEFVLLRSCFSLPKVSYVLRTCPPTPVFLRQ